MPYSRYLKTGQKVMLRSLNPETSPERFDALTCFLQGQGPDHLDLTLPYQVQEGEGYPFAPGMAFELLADALGLGIRLTGHFHSAKDDNQIRFQHNRDLQLIRRRIFRRRDVTIGMRYTRGRGTLRSFRDQWEKNIQILQSGNDLGKLSGFPRCRVNLSGGGLRFGVKLPAEASDLCLLLFELPDGKAPICALGEVIWRDDTVIENRCQVGMQFIQILEADRKRIDQFVLAGDSEADEDETHRVVGQS